MKCHSVKLLNRLNRGLQASKLQTGNPINAQMAKLPNRTVYKDSNLDQIESNHTTVEPPNQTVYEYSNMNRTEPNHTEPNSELLKFLNHRFMRFGWAQAEPWRIAMCVYVYVLVLLN